MILAKVIAALIDAPAKARRSSRARSLLEEAASCTGRGELARAEACYVEVLALEPAAARAHAALALLLTARGRADQALHHFRAARSAAMLPRGCLESFIRLLLQQGERAEAIEVAREAARADASACESWFALGLALLAHHSYSDALAAYDQCLALGPNADVYVQRGIALQNLGRFDEARADYGRALQERPSHALARFHRGLAWLVQGNYAAGWADYEARLASGDAPARPLRYPRWDGSPPNGRTLLLYGEQGLGDEIMFASCLADLVRAGARCVVECNPALLGLFTRSFPGATVYPASPDGRVPDDIAGRGIDAEAPLGSLPMYFRGTLAAFPKHQGYLKADETRIAAWRARIAGLRGAMSVGISWVGGTHASRGPLRSIALDAWLPILRTAGVKFVSLQYTPDAPQAVQALRQRHGIDITHWPEAIADYDETAALVSALDLTISVCTSVIHLAGALGRPVWIMAPSNPEWRYGCAGAAMPWYPSARVFRQQREREWNDVIAEVSSALAEAASAAHAPQPVSAQSCMTAGLQRLEARDFPAAQACFERAVELSPAAAEAHCNLGLALLEQGNGALGERHLREAARLDPRLLPARENLAVWLSRRFDDAAALEAWNDVLALDPDHAEAHAGKAFMAMRSGHFCDARSLLSRAVELGADRRSELDLLDAQTLLAKGEFARGWPLYEGRLNGTLESARRPYPFPEWDGSALSDGVLLILGEQGLGDEIMFASCYAEAIARAGRCVIECEPRLAGLFARSFPEARVVGHPRESAERELLASGDIVRQVHAGSLPKLFRPDRSAFPRHAGYLVADTARERAWREKLAAGSGRRLIGIAWSGGLKQTRRSLRSIPLAEFSALLDIAGVEFVSLQHDDDGSEAAELARLSGASVRSFGAALADLDDTAALIGALDCVLTVCSTVVHLTGALGVPAIVMTPQRAEWRYLREGASLPWYPGARLVRQRQSGEWAGAIDEARTLLMRDA